MLAPGETQFQDAVIQAAQAAGWLVMHTRPAMDSRGHWSTPLQGNPGFPDLVLARAGVVLIRELKTTTGELFPAQQRWGAELGDLWGVWTPNDWDTIRAEIAGRRPGMAPWLARRRVELALTATATTNPDGTITGHPTVLADAVLKAMGAAS